MLTIHDLIGATAPVAQTDIEALLEHLGYDVYETNGTCNFWRRGEKMPLQIMVDSYYAARDGFDAIYPPDYAQEIGQTLARHQRILAKAPEGPAR